MNNIYKMVITFQTTICTYVHQGIMPTCCLLRLFCSLSKIHPHCPLLRLLLILLFARPIIRIHRVPPPKLLQSNKRALKLKQRQGASLHCCRSALLQGTQSININKQHSNATRSFQTLTPAPDTIVRYTHNLTQTGSLAAR